MAGRSDIEAGKAHIKLYAKGDPLTQGIKAAMGGAVGVIKQAAGVMGGLLGADLFKKVVKGLADGLTHFQNFGRELKNMSDRTGMAAGSLAELKFAAEQSGAGIGDIESAIADMQSKGYRSSQFDMLAQQIAGIQDPAIRAQRAMDIFGSSGKKLLPMFAELKSLKGQAKSLGLAPSEEEVSRANKLKQTFDQLTGVMSAGLFKLGAAIAPVVQPMLEGAVKLVAKFNEWAFTNNIVIDTIKSIGQAMSGGSFMLAGQIAAKSLQLAFQSAADYVLDIIESLFGSLVADYFGTRWTALISGDFVGVFKTEIALLGELWGAFSVGVVETFAMAANAVIGLWKKSVNAISDYILQKSSEGGAFGKFMSAVLGVDMQAEQKKADELNKKLGLGPENITEKAKQVAREQTAETAKVASEFIKGIQDQAAQNYDQAHSNFKETVAGGRGKSRNRVDELQKEVAELRDQAAAAAGEVAKPKAAGDFGAIAKGQSLVQFSASALLASASGPQNETAKNTRKAVEVLQVIAASVSKPGVAGQFI